MQLVKSRMNQEMRKSDLQNLKEIRFYYTSHKLLNYKRVNMTVVQYLYTCVCVICTYTYFCRNSLLNLLTVLCEIAIKIASANKYQTEYIYMCVNVLQYVASASVVMLTKVVRLFM